MDPALVLRGFILGFTIAAAVGPISLLVIRRTIAQGQLYGLVSGLGVATADATYGAIAAFGLAAITDVLVDARVVLGLVGGLFLLWMAWQTIRSSPTEADTSARTSSAKPHAGGAKVSACVDRNNRRPGAIAGQHSAEATSIGRGQSPPLDGRSGAGQHRSPES